MLIVLEEVKEENITAIEATTPASKKIKNRASNIERVNLCFPRKRIRKKIELLIINVKRLAQITPKNSPRMKLTLLTGLDRGI